MLLPLVVRIASIDFRIVEVDFHLWFDANPNGFLF